MRLGIDYDIKYEIIYRNRIHDSDSIGTVVPSSQAEVFMNANQINDHDEIIFTKSPNNLGVYEEEDEFK